MGRIACAFVGRFELACRARADASLWTRAVAVADVAAARGVVHVASPGAEAHGVRAGQPVARALAVCPALELLAPDEAGVAKARGEVLNALAACSPALDDDGRGAFFLDVGGLEAVHGSEAQSARRVREALASVGFEATVGVADGSLAAWVAARRARPVTLVPAGGDGAALSDVPLAELGLSPATLERLGLFGLSTAGELAGLPPGTLAARLPEEGAGLERFCRAEAPVAWPSERHVPRPPEEVALDLDGPVEGVEPLVFVAKSLVDRLLGRLARERRALAELVVVVGLDDRAVVTHRLEPATPTLDGRALVELVRLWLASAPLGSPVVSMRLVAARLGVATPRQVSLFEQRREQLAGAHALAVARLEAAFGEENVVRPVLVDAHRPEKRALFVPWGAGAATKEVGAPAAPVEALLLRTPPEPVRFWDGRRLVPGRGRAVDVAAVEGPHRVGGEWWADAFDRSYYWLTGTRGERLWIFRDEATGRVYLHAVAD